MEDSFRVIDVKRSIFDNNDRQAEKLCRELKEKKVFLLNLMSSPGSGKTTTLVQTIRSLGERLNIAVMEADIDSSVDARTIEALGTENVDLVILENVGNLVCPA